MGAVDPTEFRPLRPPILRTSTVVDAVLASSSAYFVRTRNLSPWNFSGQWHCSQVSRAGRRCFTGDWIGRAYVSRLTAKSCRVPESFERTNQRRRGDVALHTADAGMRRVHVGRVFGRHHLVAGHAAELRRVHVFDAAVGGRAQDPDVQDGGDADEGEGVLDDGRAEVDVRVVRGERAAPSQAAPPPPDAGRDQQQPQDEQGRQHEEEEDARIGMGRLRAEGLARPEQEEGHRGARGDHGPGQGDSVLAQVEQGTRPSITRPAHRRPAGGLVHATSTGQAHAATCAPSCCRRCGRRRCRAARGHDDEVRPFHLRRADDAVQATSVYTCAVTGMPAKSARRSPTGASEGTGARRSGMPLSVATLAGGGVQPITSAPNERARKRPSERRDATPATGPSGPGCGDRWRGGLAQAEHRRTRVLDDLLGHAAEEQVAEPAPAVRCHHRDVRSPSQGHLHDGVRADATGSTLTAVRVPMPWTATRSARRRHASPRLP